jgi:hypothetical protein
VWRGGALWPTVLTVSTEPDEGGERRYPGERGYDETRVPGPRYPGEEPEPWPGGGSSRYAALSELNDPEPPFEGGAVGRRAQAGGGRRAEPTGRGEREPLGRDLMGRAEREPLGRDLMGRAERETLGWDVPSRDAPPRDPLGRGDRDALSRDPLGHAEPPTRAGERTGRGAGPDLQPRTAPGRATEPGRGTESHRSPEPPRAADPRERAGARTVDSPTGGLPTVPPGRPMGDPGEAYRADPTERLVPRHPPQADGDGIYRTRRPVIAALLVVMAAAAELSVFRVLAHAVFGLKVIDASATLGGLFTMVGIPIFTVGLYALVTGAAAPVTRLGPRIWLRTPLIYIPIGLALFLAAGMAT